LAIYQLVVYMQMQMNQTDFHEVLVILFELGHFLRKPLILAGAVRRYPMQMSPPLPPTPIAANISGAFSRYEECPVLPGQICETSRFSTPGTGTGSRPETLPTCSVT
jgi:hypothetical protein